MSFLDAFGRLAETTGDRTVAAGRYAFQADDEARIVPDLITKLRLGPDDVLLEIGCGVGNLLLPLSEHVAAATGVDHPSCLARFAAALPPNVSLIPGSWPDAAVEGSFTRVLAYSVLHYLDDAVAAERFIDACTAVLAPDGWLLLGDLPNRDAAARFTATTFGRKFTEAWRQRLAGVSDSERERDVLFAATGGRPPYIDDTFILTTLGRLRRGGMEAYVVPQSPGLPFCHTREDVLVHKRPS